MRRFKRWVCRVLHITLADLPTTDLPGNDVPAFLRRQAD